MAQEYAHALVLFYNRRHHPLMVRWARERLAGHVTVAIVDLAEVDTPHAVEHESKEAGADQVIRVDGRAAFCDGFLAPAVRADAVYQHGYLLSAALERPMLATVLARIAAEVGADCIVHGFRGNDQVRLDMALDALGGPPTRVPLREGVIEEVEVDRYAATHGIPDVDLAREGYTVSDNLWGRSTECGALEDAALPPRRAIFRYTTPADEAPDEPARVVLGFERGLPVSIDGELVPFVAILRRLNALAARHGVGVSDIVEDGLVGLKSRAIYEHPGASCLLAAHRDLERFVCGRHENRFKRVVSDEWTALVYAGLWFDPLRAHLDAWLESMNLFVTGTVTLRLYRGGIAVEGRAAAASIYRPDRAIYRFGHEFGAGDAVAFGRVHNTHTLAACRRGRREDE